MKNNLKTTNKKMKRNFMHRLVASAATVLLTLGFVACVSNDEPVVTPLPEKEPSVQISAVRSTTTSATVLVEPQNAEACYIDYVVKGEAEPSVDAVIASGEEFTTVGGNYTINELIPETTYVVFAAVSNGDKKAMDRVEVTTAAEQVEGAIELNLLLEALYSTNNTAGNGNYEIVIGNTETMEWEGDAQMLINFYNEPDADPLNAVLPSGTYEAGSDNAPFTYNPSNTYISIVVGGELVTSPVIGTITVDRKGPEYSILVDGLLFTTQDPIKVAFKGAIQFVESETAEWVRFDTPQEVTFEQSQGRYWGNWFYPFADDLGLELFAGSFNENNTLVKGYYLHLSNLYIPKLADYNTANVDIASGTYTVVVDRYDYVNTYAMPFTFDRGKVIELYDQTAFQGTYVTYVDKEQNISKLGLVTGGTITISGSGDNYLLEFDLVTEEGISITGSYQGALNLGNYNDNDLNPNWGARPWSTLTSDYTYDWKPETEAYAFLMGDYIKEGLNTWMVMIMATNSTGEGYGDYFTTELLVDVADGAEFPTGTFNVGWELNDHTMLPGFMDFGGNLLFTYYGDLTVDAEGYSMATAPITSGTVTISKEGEAYRFLFDMIDDAGNKVTGEWQGAIAAEDLRDDMTGGGDEDHNHDHAHALKQALRARR